MGSRRVDFWFQLLYIIPSTGIGLFFSFQMLVWEEIT